MNEKDIKKQIDNKTLTTSDAIKSSFTNVYKLLDKYEYLYLKNQRKDDLVITKADDYKSIDDLFNYDRTHSFDGKVRSVKDNIFLCRQHIKRNTYLLMKFESNNVTFPDVEYIANKVETIKTTGYEFEKEVTEDLMQAWKYTLTNYEDISLDSLQRINFLVSKHQSLDPGKLRTGNTSVTGTSFKPEIPSKEDAQTLIDELVNADDPIKAVAHFIPKAIKKQLFWDGNKRTAFIFANMFLISMAKGLVIVDEQHFEEFNELLNQFYEMENNKIYSFIMKKCQYSST